MSNSTKKINILCLYAEEDLEVIQKLEKHLIASNQNIEFRTFSNKDIDSIQRKIIFQNEVNLIQIFLISVSINFITSKINTSIEMQKVMQQHEGRKSTVIPVIISPCNWYTFPYAMLQSTPSKPIIDNNWNSIDDAILSVVQGIEHVIISKKI